MRSVAAARATGLAAARSVGLVVSLASSVLWVFSAGVAHADDETVDPAPAGGTSFAYSHMGQIGVHAQIGPGYRLIGRYDEDDFCGNELEPLCDGRTPFVVQVGASYAATNAVELVLDFHVGLEDDFKPATATGSAPRPFAVAPGIKLLIDDVGSLKWFTTFQVVFDLTDHTVNGVGSGVDLAFRNMNGLLVDLHRTFGVYVYFGETFGFVRWLRFEVDGGIGVEMRFP